jgi:hypothetical protein
MAGSEDIQNGNDEIGSQSDPSLGPVWLSPIVRRWSIILVCVLAAALAALYAFSESRQTHAASEIMEKASARFSIFLIAQELRAHFDSTGSFPATLEELDLDEEGIEYLTNGTTFRLVVVEGSNSIVYAEGEDSEIFRSSFKVLEEGAVQ